MQQFLKENTALRITLIALTFLLGMYLVIKGWNMTGQLNGLWTMLGGVASLIVSLFIYNKPFQ